MSFAAFFFYIIAVRCSTWDDCINEEGKKFTCVQKTLSSTPNRIILGTSVPSFIMNIQNSFGK